MANFELIKKEYSRIIEELNQPEVVSDRKKLEELAKKQKKLNPVVEKIRNLEEAQKQIKESQEIVSSEKSPELVALAKEELATLEEKEKTIKINLFSLLKEKEEVGSSPDAIIVEIRAGAGGDEATLFVGNLFRMYSRYAENKRWPLRVLNTAPTELGGYKEVVFEIRDKEAFSKMKYEAGVHRVQRVPETEKSGRIHTSTASVAVLSKAKPQEMKIKPDEIKVDHFKSSGPGGQNVNKRETAIRITHLPSGIVVNSQSERNQLQNKENAMSILSARLLEKKREEADSKTEGKRRSQIGTADRSEKIRTYNFPQDRVTDHRIKKTFHNIEEIMEGGLDPIIAALDKNLHKD
jgi:peptide chain release factor 1